MNKDSLSILQAEGISFAYGKEPVIRGLDISVIKGEFLGLIGPNGSGKTTLLKLLTHILIPAKGRIILQEKAIQEMKRREISQKIAFIPQEESTPFAFTAMEICLMGRTPYLKGFQMEGDHDIEVTRRAMSITDCYQFRDRNILTLSGGERRRVYIARALAQEPEIILMDEPTTHLDIHHQVEIMERVEELNRGGLTVVMVSHDINLASRFCSRVTALKEGKVITSGKPGDVVDPDLLETLYGCRLKVSMEGERPFVTLERENMKGGG
ncbi:MAG: ABC transporter ATP-binding protein [Thermodesulfobacteriota bacterium]